MKDVFVSEVGYFLDVRTELLLFIMFHSLTRTEWFRTALPLDTEHLDWMVDGVYGVDQLRMDEGLLWLHSHVRCFTSQHP